MKAVWIALMMSFVSIAATAAGPVAISESSRAILDTASQLDTEGQTARVLKELEAKPHAKVVAAVREGLAQGAPYLSVAAKTASTMKLTEVVPDLQKSFNQSGDWALILALGELANDSQKRSLAADWQRRLPKLESPAQVAMIETLAQWGQPLSREQFDSSLSDKYPGVRLAAARAFFKTRTKLSLTEQQERYRKAFSAKPYQVRLSAMTDFSQLDGKERESLAGVIDQQFKKACASESKAEVKDECQKLLKEAK